MFKNKLLTFLLLGSLSVPFTTSTLNAPQDWSTYLKDGAYKGAQDVASGPLGWIGNAGVLYYGLTTQSSIKSTLLLGALAVGHGSLLKAWWDLRCDCEEMSLENTTNNMSKRTVWAGYTNGYQLWNAYPTRKNQIRADLLSVLGNQKLHEQIQAELSTAFNRLNAKLSYYSCYTNILDTIAYEITGSHNHDQLLKGDALIKQDCSAVINNIVNESFNRSSWIANSLRPGLFWQKRVPIRLPWLYSSTYNQANACVAQVLEQYARLKAVKAIIDNPNYNNNA